MFYRICFCLLAALALFAQPTTMQASVTCPTLLKVTFVESAPRDLFHLDNQGDDSTNLISMSIDLTPSKGRLIFDTQEGGSGVEVFQSFRNESTEAQVRVEPTVLDGATYLRLDFDKFMANTRYSFSIDLDDQLTNSELGQIRIAGGEIEGAEVTATYQMADQKLVFAKGVFSASKVAFVNTGCFDANG